MDIVPLAPLIQGPIASESLLECPSSINQSISTQGLHLPNQVEGTVGVERPQPISPEVNHVQVEQKVEGEEKAQGENGPQDASGDDRGNEREPDALLGAPAFHERHPFEGAEMESVDPSLLAGYLGVTMERAVSLRQTTADLQMNPAIKKVLWLKCQVTADWKIYPLGKADGVMDAVERYLRIMKEEAGVFQVEWQAKKKLLDDPNGFTAARLHKLVTELPTNLKAILSCFEGFFDDAKGLDRLLRNMPALQAKI